MKVRLTEEQVRFCERLADRRQAHDKEHGYKDRRQTSRPGIEYDGMTGEAAFCVLFGLVPDVQHDRPMPEDATVGGMKIDVKCTVERPPRLNVAGHKRLDLTKVAAFALMYRATRHDFIFIGWQHADFVMQERFRKINPRTGKPYWSVPEFELYPPSELCAQIALLDRNSG